MAHFAIDVAGDYVLPRDSYDHLSHGSRELAAAAALLIAVVLAGRGLRICCEIAAQNRTRLLRPVLHLRETLGMFCGAAAASAVIVPAMECLDGWTGGTPVRHLGDAFGGSIMLGLGTTLICAVLVTFIVYALARWLIAHRDAITTIIETLLLRAGNTVGPSRYALLAYLVTPRRRRTTNALRLSKRGPPAARFASFS
jgi:hypothetical protein